MIRPWNDYVDMLRPLEQLIELTWKPGDEA